MTPIWIGLGPGNLLDWQYYTQSSLTASGFWTVPMVGWEWWYLVGGIFTTDNTAGAVLARGRVAVLDGSTSPSLLVWEAVGNNDAAIGGTWTNSFGFGVGSIVSATDLHSTFPTPLVPWVGDGTISINFFRGDANTKIQNGRFIVAGQRAHPRSSR